MAYAGIQMFMDKLNQLINCYDIPFINNPEIIHERPQFQILYEELGSIIQTLFIDQHQDLHDLQKVSDLKQRFIDAVEEADYNVDLFLTGVHIRNNRHFPTFGDFKRSLNLDRSFKSVVNLFLSCVHIRNNEHDSSTSEDIKRSLNIDRSFKSVVNLFLSCVHIRNNGNFPTSGDFKRSLNLDDVRRSFKSVEVEFMSLIMDGMKAESSQRPERTLNQFAPTPISFSRNLLGSKKLMGEIFVGIDRDAELIRDKLVEDRQKLDVLSIVGMGGVGKTTLATKVFNDAYVKHHFYVRVWVTVSQTYNKRAVLTQILESIRGQLNLEQATDSQLRESVHKNLMGKRYLIVIDDIWHTETWDNLKLFFPHDNNGSRILLTSRLTAVANRACPDGLIHHLGSLNKENCWKLLCQKVFHGSECPEWAIEPGMKIVENCQGLPLAVVVIAGVLAKEAWSKTFWEEISYKTGSYLVGDQNGCMETLGLSYNHLPLHLRECFLYLGGLPEDYMFKVQRLIRLWVAEGFIQKDGNRSLEEIAEGYLMDLIDRNLVIVDRWKSNGGVKACKVHDLVRELCLKKAREDRFILTGKRLTRSSQHNKVKKPPYRPERMFIDEGLTIPSAQNCRSVLLFGYINYLSDDIAKHFCSFVLIRVLDLQECKLYDFPKGMGLLVHLRYLAICKVTEGFPDSICNLWNLQTLIYITKYAYTFLPNNISDLVNLRHLSTYSPTRWWFIETIFIFPSIERPMKNLQTISGVKLGDGVYKFRKCFPYIKKLNCLTCTEKQSDFKSLTCLEKLKVYWSPVGRRLRYIRFPTTLKTLALEKCHLPWNEVSIIQSIPNLQFLKLKQSSFEGSCWNTDGQEFPQLKFLRLHWLDIKQWEAYSRSFPCLRQLEITRCFHLEEIPLEIGDIPTLELIQIRFCRSSVGESVRRIEEEQHDLGNYALKIDIQEELH